MPDITEEPKFKPGDFLISEKYTFKVVSIRHNGKGYLYTTESGSSFSEKWLESVILAVEPGKQS